MTKTLAILFGVTVSAAKCQGMGVGKMTANRRRQAEWDWLVMSNEKVESRGDGTWLRWFGGESHSERWRGVLG
jgi:hypothetical protein